MQQRRYITLHIEADTPEQLSMLTVATQNFWGADIEFFDFQQTKKGKERAWFRIPIHLWTDKQAADGKKDD